jgi:hypothetical protein
MSQCRATKNARNDYILANELYLFSKKKGSVDKTLKAIERWLSQQFPGLEVDYKGNVLAPKKKSCCKFN